MKYLSFEEQAVNITSRFASILPSSLYDQLHDEVLEALKSNYLKGKQNGIIETTAKIREEAKHIFNL